jgi:molybdate transport system substrate-binding protein
MRSLSLALQFSLMAALVWGAASAGIAWGPPPEAARETVLLFAAASAKEFVEDVVAEFRRKHPRVTVKTSFGGSSTLAQQVLAGADADLFLSANQAWARTLDQRQLASERCDLLGNELVLVVAKGARLKVAAPEDLLSGELRRIALAEPDSVPAGIYAKQALTKLALWDRLKPRIVGAADVRQALAYVETGAAEAGIVYATDAALTDRVEIAYRFDAELTEPIVYPLVLLERGGAKPSVRELYQEFQSDHAAERARKRGFTWRPTDAARKP